MEQRNTLRLATIGVKWKTGLSLQILYTFVLFFGLYAEIVNTFEPEVVTISARNRNMYKICNFHKATVYFPYFTALRNEALQFGSFHCVLPICCN